MRVRCIVSRDAERKYLTPHATVSNAVSIFHKYSKLIEMKKIPPRRKRQREDGNSGEGVIRARYRAYIKHEVNDKSGIDLANGTIHITNASDS